MPVAARKASAKKPKAQNRLPVKKKAAPGRAKVVAKTLATTRGVQEVQVIERAARWAGTQSAAKAWFTTQPIPALGGHTAEALVKLGKFEAVLFYLDSMDAGAFA